MALLVLLSLGCRAAGSESPVPRGYQPRACGFDLSRNGIPGEPADCQVCDGETADPDGDGVAEDLIYVDCGTGQDVPGCGAAGAPCGSLAFAFDQVADGPGDGAEDIVCFRGTCTESADLTPPAGGVPGTYTRRARGSESRSFELPSNPAMLVGWDADNDGSYPPFDTDDTAVLDGKGANRAFFLNAHGADNSFFEMAHFTARDYGRYDADPTTGGFLKVNHAGPGRGHLYLHDLSLRGINQDRPGDSGRIAFDWFHLNDYRYLAFVNLELLETGGYLNRGAGPDGGAEAGPIRFQSLTYTQHSCDYSGPEACEQPDKRAFAVGWKLWGYISGVEVLDSVIDANVEAWEPKPAGGPAGSVGVGVAQCSRDWTVRNNEFIDTKIALAVQAWDASACRSPGRTVDGIVFDRNRVSNTYPAWGAGSAGVSVLGGGPSVERTSGDITVRDNVFSFAAGTEAAILVRAGNDGGKNPGRIRVAGNTIDLGAARGGGIAIAIRRAGAYPHQDFVIEDNTIRGLTRGGFNLHLDYEPAHWRSDRNLFDRAGRYAWGGTPRPGLAAWRAASGGDRSSSERAARPASPPATPEPGEQARPPRQEP